MFDTGAAMDWADKRERTVLPIDEKLAQILGLLKQNKVVVCVAETGAGKTTRIGQAALLADPKSQVILTQTRRNAIRWNGQRIAAELGCNPGQLVGWRLFGENPVISEATRLQLMIDQSLVQRIRRENALPKGLIIVDEAHERSVSIDLLLGLIKEHLPTSPDTRILITSATIDAEKFSAFFSQAPIIHVKGFCHPVSTEVFELAHAEHHTEGAARAVCDVILPRFLQNQLTVPTLKGDGQTVITKGSILILLPGKEDIKSVLDELSAKVQKYKVTERVQLLSCHGESLPEEQALVQQPVPENTLRIVCGTEVLRSSVTITETIGVVDSLQIKRFITNANGVGELSKIPVSKAEADQAKGRAGRTAPGFYMPISFNSEYNRLEAWPQPAILREPIINLALQVAAVGRSIRNFKFIDAPPLDKVTTAIDQLKVLGAIAEDETITATGERLVNIPLSPELAKVLLTAGDLDVLAEAIVVTAVLEIEGFFHGKTREQTIVVDATILAQILPLTGYTIDKLPEWITPKNNYWEIHCTHPNFPERKESNWVAKLMRKAWAGKSQNDFVAIVRAYRAFHLEDRKAKQRRHTNDLPQWCALRGLNLKRIRLAEEKMDQICKSGISLPPGIWYQLGTEREFNEENLSKSLLSGKIDNIARPLPVSHIGPKRREYSGKMGIFKLAFESACSEDTLMVLISGVTKVPIKISNRTNHCLLAVLATPINPLWIPDIMPHLCIRQRKGNHHYDSKRRCIVETETIYYRKEYMLSQTEVVSTAKDFSLWLTNQCNDSNNMLSVMPLDSDPLNQLVQTNAERQKLARQLNHRAGQQVFTVFSHEELVKFFTDKLSATGCNFENAQLTILALPVLNEALVGKILTENPLRIQILGFELQVDYQETPGLGAFQPRVRFPLEIMHHHRWPDLLTTVITLPGGRLVSVEIGSQFSLRWTSNGKVNFSRGNLTSVSLTNTDLRGANCLEANLTGVNLTKAKLKGANLAGACLDKITFVEESLFFRFSAEADELNHLPYLLSVEEINTNINATQAINRLLKYTVTQSQLEYIKWCVVMQFIETAIEKQSIDNLKWLMQQPILTSPEYSLKLYNDLSTTFSSVISFFGGSAKTTVWGEQSMCNKIQQAILSITNNHTIKPAASNSMITNESRS